jgi:hypothetical protein
MHNPINVRAHVYVGAHQTGLAEHGDKKYPAGQIVIHSDDIVYLADLFDFITPG